jgi:hypothetical protein
MCNQFKSVQNHIEYIIAGNSHTEPEVLDKLALSSCENVRRQVAENPATNLATLMLLLGDKSPEVRLALTYNRFLPATYLEWLSRDESDDLRFAMAENPHIPSHILESLSQDSNPYVANRAQKTLARLNPRLALVA